MERLPTTLVSGTGPRYSDTVSVGVTVAVSAGVSVGNAGPIIGSVGSSSAPDVGGKVGGGAVATDASVGDGQGLSSRVGSGVGSGPGPDGRATITRLNTMLAAMIKLMSHRTFWLVVRVCRFRLLTGTTSKSTGWDYTIDCRCQPNRSTRVVTSAIQRETARLGPEWSRTHSCIAPGRSEYRARWL